MLKKQSSSYCAVPFLHHREVYKYLMECFPSSHFNIQYESTDLRAEVCILGYKVTGHIERYFTQNSIPFPEIKECLFFSIVQENELDARTTFHTNFWVTVHRFQPCSPIWIQEGQIQSLMEQMVLFMQLLEETSPGEFRLRFDGDIPSDWDENELPGVNMRALYALAHGQTRLNSLGIQDNQFENKYLDFKKYLQSDFCFKFGKDNLIKFHKYRKLLGEQLSNIPKNDQVFQGIYSRIRYWNDQLNEDPTVNVDQVEIDLYCKIIDGHVAEVERFFPSRKIHMLKMERQIAPELDIEDVSNGRLKKIPITAAQRLSKPYYISAFPSRSKEWETIAQQVKSRRKPLT